MAGRAPRGPGQVQPRQARGGLPAVEAISHRTLQRLGSFDGRRPSQEMDKPG
jgi:hypothetical protein